MMLAAHPSVPHHNHTTRWGNIASENINTSIEEDELQDICTHVQPSNQAAVPSKAAHATKTATEETEAPPAPTSTNSINNNEDSVQEEASIEDTARICLMKREAIMLLSTARKSSSGVDRIRAMTLLSALYKAQTKHDMVMLSEKVKELLEIKKREEAEMERIRAEEEANKTPERFSRVRARFRRILQAEGDARSVASEPSPCGSERNGKKWRFFWQKDANDGRRSSHSNTNGGGGIHGINMQPNGGGASNAESTVTSRMEGLEVRRKIWDTRTI